MSNLDSLQVHAPKSIHEALRSPEWKDAVWNEICLLEKNGMWEITELPFRKWIVTIKDNPDESINRYKARLLAQGFSQSYGINYQETFAAVAKHNTIRVLLTLAANIEIPLVFETSTNSNKVCKLKKPLYGLKQSPRVWFDRFTKAVKRVGYDQCQRNHTIFVTHSLSGKKATLIVYVLQ